MRTSPSPPIIELRQVNKTYCLGEARIAALKGINLCIDAGEFVAIWGPSGSGKSTLCNLIGMLDIPSSGTVQLKGQDVTNLTDDARSEARNKAIGFVFQSFNLIPVLSALENVMLPLHIRGEPLASSREKAFQRLAELGLADHAEHRPSKLSGGEQQRVAIARALVTAPVLVVADEPTANLDSHTAVRLIELMREVNSKDGTTFIFSTHDQRLLERVGRQVLMRDGAIVEDETVWDAREREGRIA